MKTVIYHNPRCSKSRATLELLESRNIEPTVVRYLDTPPSASRLKKLCSLLGKRPAELIRFNEKVAKENGWSADDKRTADQWLKLIVANPVLLERPIVVVDDRKAVIGRPPENVLAII